MFSHDNICYSYKDMYLGETFDDLSPLILCPDISRAKK